MKTTAIVLAAGQGKRMKSDVQKQYMLLENKPLIYYALKCFEDSFIDEIILVVGTGEMQYAKKEIVEKYNFQKVTAIVEGGKERYHSVYNGILAIKNTSYVFIHDGARPFVSEEILDRVFAAVQKEEACVVGMPVKDTIKIADEKQFAVETPNRDLVWMIQTPQVFSYDLIYQAYTKLIENEQEIIKKNIVITDDAMAVEQFMNHTIKLVEGSYSNIKITTPDDLKIAETLVKREA